MRRDIAVVAVYGDLGRSPRMINHVRELIKANFQVNIIGYDGDIDEDISLSPHVKFHFVSPFKFAFVRKNYPILSSYLNSFFFTLRLILLSLYLILTLVNIFFLSNRTPKIMIIQTPPVLPLFALSIPFCMVFNTKLVVDWHNLGYTLIQKRSYFLRFIYKWVEIILGHFCSRLENSSYICVSNSMKKWMMKNFRIKTSEKIHVLYDKPNEKYYKLEGKERSKIRENFLHKLNIVDKKSLIFVSSTSWTPDEDFEILLEAISKADAQISKATSLKRRIAMIITGKGPMRKDFEEKSKYLRLKNADLITVWLEPSEYPKLLACADIGISLHTSSSGLDLPMKIVDMIGSGLPVCAYEYDCLSELLDENSGYLFQNSDELSQIITKIATGKETEKLATLRSNLFSKSSSTDWSDEWKLWFKEQNLRRDL